MAAQVRGFLASVASRIPAVLVLAALVGVGVFGYLNDWKLPRLFAGPAPVAKDESAPDAAHAPAADTPTEVPPVKLSAEAASKAGVETEAVVERPMSKFVHAHGSFAYDQTRYARLGPRAAGVVWQVCRRPGETVHQGDLLAVVESADVGRAKAAFLLSLVQAEFKDKALQAVQAQSKIVPGAFPELSIREAESQLREARAHLFADQQALFNLGLPLSVEEVAGQPEDKVMRRMRLLGLPESVVKPLDPATATANLLPVISPLDGVVIGAVPAIGDAAAPDRPLFQIADTHIVWEMCELRLEDVGQLAVGQEIVVRPDGAAEDAPPGRLTWLSTEADEKTHTVQARAEVPNPEGKLRPNTPFEGRITVGVHSQVVAVPNDSLQWDRRGALLFVRVADDAYQPRRVQVGVRDGDYREITAGVRPGDVVVIRGSHVLKSEMLKDRIAGDD